MSDDPVKEFEALQSEIEELKVKRLSDLREKERLEKEFEDLKKQIREAFGTDIEDFEQAIENLKAELARDMEQLKTKIAACRAQMAEK